jgi:hypothetical protein
VFQTAPVAVSLDLCEDMHRALHCQQLCQGAWLGRRVLLRTHQIAALQRKLTGAPQAAPVDVEAQASDSQLSCLLSALTCASLCLPRIACRPMRLTWV